MYTGHGKRAAFLTVSFLLSACGGGGGGGTIATPAPTPIVITAFTSWRTDLAGNTIKADGVGKQVAYTWNGTNISGITPIDEATASATFVFDATRKLTGLIIDSTPNTSTPSTTTAGFAGSQLKVLAHDSDFTTAASASSHAVFSNPKSLAWDYQSFGSWETGLGTDTGNREYGVMSVGAPTVGTDIPGSGTASSNFIGKVVGNYISPEGQGHDVLATLNVGVDWNTRSLSFTTSGTQISKNGSTFAAPSVVLSSPVNLEISGTLNYDPNINSFSGTLTTGGLSGSSTGQFYGPTAQELGGVFFLQGSDPIETYAGAYGAKQTP